MKMITPGSAVGSVSYPGCGMIVGKSDDGLSAVFAYFIMGRSAMCKNRVFCEDGDGIRISAFRETSMPTPASICYSPVLEFGNMLIMGNGAHVSEMQAAIQSGDSFERALSKYSFFSNNNDFTPRLTSLVTLNGSDFTFKTSIIKPSDANGVGVSRYVFGYENIQPGTGYYVHTFMRDESPLTAFTGEPKQVSISGSIFDIVADVWENLNHDNKVSLWVRTIDLSGLKVMSRIINKNR